jgi:hypothetical protein
MKMMYRHLKGYKYENLRTIPMDTDITGYDISTRYLIMWPDGRLFVRPHYAWDGPSGPTFDTKSFMRGSLIHDALYQLMRGGLIDKKHRKQADLLLKKICLEDHMPKWRAWYVYHAVRWFAKDSIKKEKEPRGKVVEFEIEQTRP